MNTTHEYNDQEENTHINNLDPFCICKNQNDCHCGAETTRNNGALAMILFGLIIFIIGGIINNIFLKTN